jgi:hypothetical protein
MEDEDRWLLATRRWIGDACPAKSPAEITLNGAQVAEAMWGHKGASDIDLSSGVQEGFAFRGRKTPEAIDQDGASDGAGGLTRPERINPRCRHGFFTLERPPRLRVGLERLLRPLPPGVGNPRPASRA